MRILVTGATGYIGGRLVPRLLDEGHDVRVLVRRPERLRDVPWAAEVGIAEGDLTVESPTGRQQLAPGGVYWMPGLTPHDVRNESGRPAKLWDIFLKRCD